MTEQLAVYETPGEIEKTQKGENGIKIFRNEFDVTALLATAGKLQANDEEKNILFAPVKEDDVEIRPDGLIYTPWMEYATRLQRAFGLEWALVPNGMPRFDKNHVYWGFWLIIKGHLCGYAIGEQEYIPQNRQMTYGDACEGAKSNALMRLCKGIGITLELWKPSFIREWKQKFSEQYWDEKKGKKLWRRKGTVGEEESDNNTSQSAQIIIPFCPECGKDSIIKGKEEYGGGYVCYKKKGGCGAKFATIEELQGKKETTPPEAAQEATGGTEDKATKEQLVELRSAMIAAGYKDEASRKEKISEITGKQVKDLTPDDCKEIVKRLMEEKE